MEAVAKVGESILLLSVPLIAACAVGGALYLELGVNQPRLAALGDRYERGLSAERARRHLALRPEPRR